MKTSVSPVLSGQFVSVIRDDSRNVIAMTLPTYDRNDAARAGMLLRSMVG